MRRLLGESQPPVEKAPEFDVPEDVPSADSSWEPEPLNWRKIIQGARLKGPVRMLAAQSQVLLLEANRVKLRLGVRSIATEDNRRMLEECLSRYLGRAFRVSFEVGILEEGATVAEAEREERVRARQALIETFKKEPIVREVMRLFGGVIDESSVRPVGEPRAPADS